MINSFRLRRRPNFDISEDDGNLASDVSRNSEDHIASK